MSGSDERHDDLRTAFPRAPIDRITGPLARFLHIEAASGFVLLVASVIALELANSSISEQYLGIFKTQLSFGIGELVMSHSLKHWISDGLMAVFFFVIGLEVKRELVLGELRDVRRASLPIAAAVGGMIAPAGIYFLLQAGEPGARGWGIPMATDIAFVVGCLALLGSRIPPSLRILLLSLAIADDIGAILVIAVGYTDELNLSALMLGVMGIGLTAVLSRSGVRSVGVYTLIGASIWLAFHESGVHATIAGVILGLITPVTGWVKENLVSDLVERASRAVTGEGWSSASHRYATLRTVEAAARESLSPLERIETTLHPWVGFAIMPVFALANAGVVIDPTSLGNPVMFAVILGLFVGKPVGIVVVSWLAVRAGLAALPEGISWGVMLAAGFLAGIGFTMALFIAGLALGPPLVEAAKLGVLIGSAISGAVGVGLLVWLLPAKPAATTDVVE